MSFLICQINAFGRAQPQKGAFVFQRFVCHIVHNNFNERGNLVVLKTLACQEQVDRTVGNGYASHCPKLVPDPHEINAARVTFARLHHLFETVLVEGCLVSAFGDGQRFGIHSVLEHLVLANDVQVMLHFTKQACNAGIFKGRGNKSRRSGGSGGAGADGTTLRRHGVQIGAAQPVTEFNLAVSQLCVCLEPKLLYKRSLCPVFA